MILITGGVGYVGSVVTQYFLSRNHKVKVLDNLTHGGQALSSLFQYDDSFEFIHGDIRDKQTVQNAMAGCDTVIHLAAIVGDPACREYPGLTNQVNIEGSHNLIDTALRQYVNKFIFISTCSNYGKNEDPNQLVDEESTLNPLSLYAESKVEIEKRLLSETNLNSTILRLSTVHGVSPRMRFDLTVNQFTRDLCLRKTLEVFAPNTHRPYVHVGDVARAIEKVMVSPQCNCIRQVFNVGDNTQNYKKVELVELIKQQIPHKCEVIYVDKNKDDPRDYRVSFDKIKEVLGFHIHRTVEDGVREIIQVVKHG